MSEQEYQNSMVFYRSFIDAIEQLPPEDQGIAYKAIVKYALDDEITPLKTPLQKMAWTLIKPQLDANKKKRKDGKKGASHGKKGGRPKKENNPSGVSNDNPIPLDDKTPNVECIIINDNKNTNKELKINNENTKVRKIIIDNAMAMSFYKKQWSFIPDGLREQDYKLSVYDTLVEWVLHNHKQNDVKFIQVSLQQVEEIYKSTSNNPEAVVNIKNCIKSNKPMLIPDSMRSAIKQIQEKNKPLTDINEINKRFEALKDVARGVKVDNE